MRSDWNVSLFHYRNQRDFGRVLVGLEAPKSEMTEFRRFLDALGGGDGEPRLPAVPRLKKLCTTRAELLQSF